MCRSGNCFAGSKQNGRFSSIPFFFRTSTSSYSAHLYTLEMVPERLKVKCWKHLGQASLGWSEAQDVPAVGWTWKRMAGFSRNYASCLPRNSAGVYDPDGGFLKSGYPQIIPNFIHFNGSFPYRTIQLLGYLPIFGHPHMALEMRYLQNWSFFLEQDTWFDGLSRFLRPGFSERWHGGVKADLRWGRPRLRFCD